MNNSKKKYVVWGTGGTWEYVKDYFSNPTNSFDKVLIASLYFEQIQLQLKDEFGIGADKTEVHQNLSRRNVKDSFYWMRVATEMSGQLHRVFCAGMHLQAKLLNKVNLNKLSLSMI